MSTPRDRAPASAVPVLTVRTEDQRTYRFTTHFLIGREASCDVRLDDARVSRRHVRVAFDRGGWRIHDQNSGNGIYIGNRRVDDAPVGPQLDIGLGPDGPYLHLEVDLPAGQTMPLSDYVERYFADSADDEPVGGRTVMIRRAYKQLRRRQRRLNLAVFAAVASVALIAGGYALYNYRRIVDQQKIAEQIFYSMKELDLSIATIEQRLGPDGQAQAGDEIKRYQERRRQLEANYETFLGGLQSRPLTPQEQLILRVTRLFGECDVAAPPEYLGEVMTYVNRWRSTRRYATAIARARDKGYIKKIAEEFQRQNLPPQFLYLAMQESDFIDTAVGPPTRMGYAKGMWMFIKDTGQRYGLTVGPLAAYARPDPGDDRHNWERATRAAAAYIKDIYATDAQASGLLVMASYNWGEGRIIRLLKSMPANPRERNFWEMLRRHSNQVPKETYDYVMSIVSAAAIGENPKLFGFDFDNPLADPASGGT